jgi:hypothetical protein
MKNSPGFPVDLDVIEIASLSQLPNTRLFGVSPKTVKEKMPTTGTLYIFKQVSTKKEIWFHEKTCAKH